MNRAEMAVAFGRGYFASGRLLGATGPPLLLPVDDAEHQLQVLSDARSPAALQFVGYASAAQRRQACAASSHMRFFGSCSRKIASHLARANRTLQDRVRLFARERENVSQEGFDLLVHPPRWKVNTEAIYGGMRAALWNWSSHLLTHRETIKVRRGHECALSRSPTRCSSNPNPISQSLSFDHFVGDRE